MHVTHPDPARKGLTLAGTLFLAELGLMLLGQLGASSFGRAWAVGQMLAWVGISAGLMVAAWQLSKALEGSELPKVVVGLGGLLVLLDLFWLWRLLQPEGLSRVPVAVSVLGSAIGVSSVGCWCVLLALLARPKLGWAVPAASVAGMLALVRTTMMLAGMLGVADAFPLLSFPSTYWVRTAISAVIPLVLGVLALSTRAGLEGVAAPAPAGLGPVAAEPGGARLVLTGAALLLVGLAVTALSFGAAEGGGRYVVATGAIATGVVQLVRGLTRLGAQR